MSKLISLYKYIKERFKTSADNLSYDFLKNKKGFGMNELLGIAAAIVIAAFIVVPGLKSFTTSIMTKLTDWWRSIQGTFFPT